MDRRDLLAIMASIVQSGSLAHPNCCELRPQAAVIAAMQILDAVDASLRERRYEPLPAIPPSERDFSGE